MVPEGENGADFCGKDADFQLTGSVAGTVDAPGEGQMAGPVDLGVHPIVVENIPSTRGSVSSRKISSSRSAGPNIHWPSMLGVIQASKTRSGEAGRESLRSIVWLAVWWAGMGILGRGFSQSMLGNRSSQLRWKQLGQGTSIPAEMEDPVFGVHQQDCSRVVTGNLEPSHQENQPGRDVGL